MTLSELRVRAQYDGKELKAGLAQSKADMRDAGEAIKRAAADAESSVIAGTKKIGAAYAHIPEEARRAYDAALTAHQAFGQRVTQSMQQVGLAMSLAITAPMALAARESLRLAGIFEQNMDVLSVSIKATAADMADLKRKAVELGADLTLPATSAVDAARAMTQLAKGGLEVRQVMDAARGTMQLAAATGIDSAEAATIQARALAAFSLKGDEATHVADLMAKATYSATGTIQDMGYALQAASAVMAKSGQSIDDTVTAITELSKAGVIGSDAGTSLKAMFLRLQEGGSIPKVRDLLRLYNIELYDASGKMKSMREVIAQFTPMMERLTEAQRNAALSIIFGSDAIRSAQIVLGGGVKAFDEMKSTLEQEGAAADLSAARNKGLAGSLDALKSAWETLMQQTAEPFLKPLADMVRSVGGLLGEISKMPEAERNMAILFGGIAAAIGPALLAVSTFRSAWSAMIGLGAVATSAKAAQASADAALAFAASQAAKAETRLAAAEGLAGEAAAAGVAPTLASAAAKTRLAAASEAAAVGSVASRAGFMAAIPMAALLTVALTALAAAVYGLYKWSRAEADQAEENARAFKQDAEDTLKAARAKVELAKQTRPLIEEYERLHAKKHQNEQDTAREKELSNQIVKLQPELAAGYKATGDAILDVAKAHDLAAAAAQGQYDKELLLAQRRAGIFEASDAAQRADDLRQQGAGMKGGLAALKAAGGFTAGGLVGDASSGMMVKDPDVLDTGGIAAGPLLDALKAFWRARDLHEGDALKAEHELLKAYQAHNAELAKASQLYNELNKKQKELGLMAKDPKAYAANQARQAQADREAKMIAELEQDRKNKQYQKDKAAMARSLGYESLEAISKDGGGGGNRPELTDGILKGMAKHVQTPAGQASCGWFAEAVLKQIGARIDSKGFAGGANDLVARLRRAGGYDVSAGEAKPGDLVHYPGRAQAHVGIYSGNGYMVDSSGGVVRDHRAIQPGAQFLRPRLTGKYDNAGDVLTHGLEAASAAAKKQAAAQLEIEKAYKKAESATLALVDADGKYAELLGMDLKVYKELAKSHPAAAGRAKRDYEARSTALTSQTLAQMRRDAEADAITDPVERAAKQYENSLADDKIKTAADKKVLVDEKRKALQAERVREQGKEIEQLRLEAQLAAATTEQERIRLQLILSRPDLKPDELAPLAKAQYDKFVSERAAAARDEAIATRNAAEAAGAQLQHTKALGKIQSDTTLTEWQRYKLIQDQNDLLEYQLFEVELLARIKKGDILDADRKAAENAEHARIDAERAAKGQAEINNELARAQDAAMQRIADKAAQARQFAAAMADVLIRPFEQMGKGNFWHNLLDGWRQTVRQMALDWAKAGLTKALDPMFKGRDQRRFDAEQAARMKAEREWLATQDMTVRAANVTILGANAASGAGNIVSGDNRMPGGATAGGRLDPAGIMLGLLAMSGKGGGGFLGQMAGLVGVLSGTGAFGKGGWLHFAQGGPTPYGAPVMVGEYGPELWTPPQSGGRMLSANETGHAIGGSQGQVTNIINVTTPDVHGFRRSQRQIASEVGEAMGREQRRNFTGR